MRDIIADIRRWKESGKTRIALATIIETRGSSLRPAGTRMALTAEGDVAGSVSSGCVDGDTIAEMEAVLAGTADIRRPFFGISDEKAWEATLSCGGAIDVLIERWDPIHDVFMEEIAAQRPVGLASRVDWPAHLLRTSEGGTLGSLGHPDLDSAVVGDMAAAWPGPYAQRHSYPQGQVFIEVVAPPPTLLIFGATDIAVSLTQLAQSLGFRVVVSDARRAFLREERFPGAELRFGWPQDVVSSAEIGPGWAVVMLFHDPKLDVPALMLSLESQAGYIGLLGSKKTQAARRASLLRAGVAESDLSRLRGPVGLDIGGREPAIIALSILAEIVAVRHRRAGGMMSGG